MASEQGGVSAAAPVFNLGEPTTLPTTADITTQPESDTTRTKSLKRSRPEQPQNPANLTSIANAGLGAPPSPKSPRYMGTFSGYSTIPLTGAAALDDERRKREESQRSQ